MQDTLVAERPLQERNPVAEQLPQLQEAAAAVKVDAKRLKEFTAILQKYKAGKVGTERRILSSENWWKLRNTDDATGGGKQEDTHQSRSGWLHNVIVSKHADAVEAFPEPNILPRETSDKEEAQRLSAIIPCVLEQNYFEQTYSDTMWQKLKTGTGVYKVMWDASRLNGLGDIAIERVNLLNLYWEPGITDIQRSRYVFQTELWDKEILEQTYPQLRDKLKSTGFLSSRFLYDDAVDTSDKATVIDVYYKQRGVLHYCKYVDDVVLYATEDNKEMASAGLYAHGKYPYVFDALFPIEGSPCGYGFVDICRNPQTEIDLMKTAFVKNVRVGAMPRYFSRNDGNVNEEEFLNMDKPIVHVSGSVDETAIRRIEHNGLDGNYLSVLNSTIDELRQTSGNTEAATGATPSGVTAASAVAALQEAAGKGSRDATRSAYRAFGKIVELCIELIRQFYSMPRQFRVVGQMGIERFITYTNKNLQAQQVDVLGQIGQRLPVFDVKISAQKKSIYTKVSNNELALQMFRMGFFNPQMAGQALMCLNMMDFDDRDRVMQEITKNGTLTEKLQRYMRMALLLAQAAKPDMVQGIQADMVQTFGQQAVTSMGAAPQLAESDNIDGLPQKEHGVVRNARAKAQAASQPDDGAVIREVNG